MNNTSVSIFQLLQSKSDIELVNILQSSFSLACTLCIFYRVFDFSSYFKSVQSRRARNKRLQQEKEYARLKTLFQAMQKNEPIDDLSLSTEDEDGDQESKQAPALRMTRKKTSKKKLTGQVPVIESV